MPTRCMAAGCSNKSSEHISLHKFPKDENLRQEWVRQVQRTRAGWPGRDGLSTSAALCSEHFLPECYDNTPALKAALGFAPRRGRKRILLRTAIPTVFKNSTGGGGYHQEPYGTRSSAAILKLNQKRVVAEALQWYELEQTKATVAAHSMPTTNWIIHPPLQPTAAPAHHYRESIVFKPHDSADKHGLPSPHRSCTSTNCTISEVMASKDELAPNMSFYTAKAGPTRVIQKEEGCMRSMLKLNINPNWLDVDFSNSQNLDENPGVPVLGRNPIIVKPSSGSGDEPEAASGVALSAAPVSQHSKHYDSSHMHRQLENKTPINIAPITGLVPDTERLTKSCSDVTNTKQGKQCPDPENRGLKLPVPVSLVQNRAKDSRNYQALALSTYPKDEPHSPTQQVASSSSESSNASGANAVISAILCTSPYTSEDRDKFCGPVLKALNGQQQENVCPFLSVKNNDLRNYGSGGVEPIKNEEGSLQSVTVSSEASSQKTAHPNNVDIRCSKSMNNQNREHHSSISADEYLREKEEMPNEYSPESLRTGFKSEEQSQTDLNVASTNVHDIRQDGVETLPNKSESESLPNDTPYSLLHKDNEPEVPGVEEDTTLAMVVEDEEVQNLHYKNCSINLNDMTSRIKSGKRKRKASQVDDFHDIEWALFPDQQPAPTKKRKNASKGKTVGRKCKKVDTVDKIMDAKKTQKEPKEQFFELEYDLDTFFDTSSEDEEVQKNKTRKKKPRKTEDSDWEPEPTWEEKDSEYEPSEEEEEATEGKESKAFECDLCDVKFTDWWVSLIAHKQKEHATKTEQIHCDICDAPCIDDQYLSSHISDVHGMNIVPNRKLEHYFCPDCKYQIPSTLCYIFHREERHESILLTCTLCKYSVEHRFQMKTHMKNIHGETDFVKYSPNVVVKNTTPQRKPTARSPSYFCPMCGEIFERMSMCNKHKRKVHADQLKHKVFQCYRCKKIFTKIHQLSHHYHIHNSELQCSFCTKMFYYYSNYRVHIELKHCGMKQDAYCVECNRIISKRSLRKHFALVHNDLRAYLCNTCGRGFKTSHSLNIHNRIHDKRKPVACEYCDYRCRQKTALNWHMKREHQEKYVMPNINLPGRPRGKARTKKNSNVKVEKVVGGNDNKP